MEIVKDNNTIALGKEQIDTLFWELNKELRKKMKKLLKYIKADLYVVGGACVVATLGTRESTTDIDAMWSIGSEMREAINAVGGRLGLSHKWCNCDFKKTKSFTNSIIAEFWVYREFEGNQNYWLEYQQEEFMKKLFITALALIIIFTFASCNNSKAQIAINTEVIDNVYNMEFPEFAEKVDALPKVDLNVQKTKEGKHVFKCNNFGDGKYKATTYVIFSQNPDIKDLIWEKKLEGAYKIKGIPPVEEMLMIDGNEFYRISVPKMPITSEDIYIHIITVVEKDS